VRAAGPDERVIANGFSCQTQIGQGAGRESEHLAQLIASALPGGSIPVADGHARRSARSGVLTGVLVAGGAALATGLLLRAINRPRAARARPDNPAELGMRISIRGPAYAATGG
jgi:hypothetical protein